ncbi:protocatechuate 3,4-dioxygenase subunit alpha [Nocardia sp. NPDC059246]|uniref:protocatechuate 3,4-dioxygenase subunit alpha n=1 Tax=unclassified Nocardia TaxID=2637762 RepID=UPI003686AC68
MSDRLFEATPSQTVGPYLHIGLSWPDGRYVVPVRTRESFWIRGHVFDGAGEAVPDALVETWQADPSGRFEHPDDPHPAEEKWRGFGRSDTVSGNFAIRTVMPGALHGYGGVQQAPHIDVSVFARGLLHRLVTRIYFPHFETANAADPVLTALEPDRRQTLIAVPEYGGYTFDIHLQGERETVFFDV